MHARTESVSLHAEKVLLDRDPQFAGRRPQAARGIQTVDPTPTSRVAIFHFALAERAKQTHALDAQ